jgi:6,7-dimethyl-8-ribityllumazine synthase
MANTFEGSTSQPPAGRFAIVVARYNPSITQKLLDGALATFRTKQVPDDSIDVAWVPGAWEIPVVAQRLARSGRYLAVICLGAVIRARPRMINTLTVRSV